MSNQQLSAEPGQLQDTVWIGVGESGVSPVTNYTYYDAMLIENGRETGPASVIRVR
jgi:hypothetical protein